jgi:hypothetical protein
MVVLMICLSEAMDEKCKKVHPNTVLATKAHMKLQGLKQESTWQAFSVMYSQKSLNRTQERKLEKLSQG